MHTGHSDQDIVALVGAPNSGKTTLFNWMTGAKFKVVNYPGSTVDYSTGVSHSRYGKVLHLVDTPGAYSLYPKSPDEQVTYEVLFENKDLHIKKVILVIDGTQFVRHTHLLKQLKESGFSVVVALTMSDLLRRENKNLNILELSKKIGFPIVAIDGTLGGGIQELIEKVDDLESSSKEPQLPEKLSAQSLESWQKELSEYWEDDQSEVQRRTVKWDQFLLHPVWGAITFTLIMLTLFSSIFWLAAPFMDYVDLVFSVLAEKTLTLGGGNLFSQFLANGIIGSFGAVLIFVPQIFILFFGIGILEDSGYLARAAAIVDRPFSKMGMNGRSFVPLLSGFACAVPAMMASRSIGSKRERWITLFIIPFMTCSARLPVYALLLSFLFIGEASWKPGLTLLIIYLGSLLMGAFAASIVNKMIKAERKSFFMMDLPLYRRPLLRVLLKNSLLRTKSYIFRAGPVIFTLSVIIWLASNFPQVQSGDAHEQLKHSYAGQVGRYIEPVFEPMGADWRVGVGLISAFAAREVFVSSLAVMFNVTDDVEDEGVRNTLIHKMQAATNLKGEPVFTLASIIGLIIFFMIALQCISTTAVAYKEMGSIKFAIFQLVSFNILAYVIAVSLVQGLRHLGMS